MESLGGLTTRIYYFNTRLNLFSPSINRYRGHAILIWIKPSPASPSPLRSPIIFLSPTSSSQSRPTTGAALHNPPKPNKYLPTSPPEIQADILRRMPTQVFAVQFGIIDSYILRIPECIFGVDNRITYFHILAVLERIVPVLGSHLPVEGRGLQIEDVHLHILSFH